MKETPINVLYILKDTYDSWYNVCVLSLTGESYVGSWYDARTAPQLDERQW